MNVIVIQLQTFINEVNNRDTFFNHWEIFFHFGFLNERCDGSVPFIYVIAYFYAILFLLNIRQVRLGNIIFTHRIKFRLNVINNGLRFLNFNLCLICNIKWASKLHIILIILYHTVWVEGKVSQLSDSVPVLLQQIPL